MKIIVYTCFLAMLALSLTLHSYTFCIDGGGSKTLIQVLNNHGELVDLMDQGMLSKSAIGRVSNINAVGKEAVEVALKELMEQTKVLDNQKSLLSLLPESEIVAGMAGVAVEANRMQVLEIFQKLGARPEKITLMTDAEMAIELVGEKGIVLISGTGSICFAKNQEKLVRVGGLGKILGDEGSGFYTGLNAIKAALAAEYGWGQPTSLLEKFKEYFEVETLRAIIPKVNSGQMAGSEIAGCTRIVFEEANEGDLISRKIIEDSSTELARLVDQAARLADLKEPVIHLWGGLFKGSKTQSFISMIEKKLDYSVLFINQSQENPAVLFAQKQTIF